MLNQCQEGMGNKIQFPFKFKHGMQTFENCISKQNVAIEATMEFDDIVLNSKEAANYMKISVGTLRNWASNGRVPYYKNGKNNVYLKSELQNLLLKYPKGAR